MIMSKSAHRMNRNRKFDHCNGWMGTITLLTFLYNFYNQMPLGINPYYLEESVTKFSQTRVSVLTLPTLR